MTEFLKTVKCKLKQHKKTFFIFFVFRCPEYPFIITFFLKPVKSRSVVTFIMTNTRANIIFQKRSQTIFYNTTYLRFFNYIGDFLEKTLL